MGAGKSTIGEQVAARLGRLFVDLDERIVEAEGVDIPTLFEQGRFRRVESQHLAEVLAGPPVVLATGGGTPCQPGVMTQLLESGWVCYLDVPLAELRRRVGGDEGRPLWDEDVEARFEGRLPVYRRAHAVVSGEGIDVAERVLRSWYAR